MRGTFISVPIRDRRDKTHTEEKDAWIWRWGLEAWGRQPEREEAKAGSPLGRESTSVVLEAIEFMVTYNSGPRT